MMYIVQMIDGLSTGGAQQLQVMFAREALRSGFKLAVISLSEDDGSVYPQQLRELGVPVYFFPTVRIRDLNTLRKIIKWFRAEKPDILHTHLTFSNIIGSFVGLLTRTPVVTTLHLAGGEAKESKVSRIERGEFFALQYLISRIIACGPAVAAYFQNIVKNRHILVIPNAVENHVDQVISSARDKLRRDISGDTQRPLLISVGRLVPQKDFVTLLEAFAILHRSHPSAFLAIAGGGELHDMLEEKIRTLSLVGHVRLLGRRQDVPRLLAVSDMYVLTSRWEGLPIAVLEAMAAGLPVLTTNVGDNAWAIAETGVTVPPEEPELFALEMAALLDDPDRCRVLGQLAKARIEKEFNPSTWFNEIISVYRNLLEST